MADVVLRLKGQPNFRCVMTFDNTSLHPIAVEMVRVIKAHKGLVEALRSGDPALVQEALVAENEGILNGSNNLEVVE